MNKKFLGYAIMFIAVVLSISIQIRHEAGAFNAFMFYSFMMFLGYFGWTVVKEYKDVKRGASPALRLLGAFSDCRLNWQDEAEMNIRVRIERDYGSFLEHRGTDGLMISNPKGVYNFRVKKSYWEKLDNIGKLKTVSDELYRLGFRENNSPYDLMIQQHTAEGLRSYSMAHSL